MKKELVLLFLVVSIKLLFAQSGDLIQAGRDRFIHYEFASDPIDLQTTYYDYMPGSFGSIPFRKLSDGSSYIVYHSKEEQDLQIKEYYTYISPDGDDSSFTIGWNYTLNGFFSSMAIDPVTDDPFVAWDSNFNDSLDTTSVVVSYDMYHVQGAGYWKYPFEIINTDISSGSENDVFSHPIVNIGTSPDINKRRLYVTANNYNDDGLNESSGNILLAYADFNGNDILNQSEFDWNYITIDQFDLWNNADPKIAIYKSCVASTQSGRIAYMGFNSDDEMFVIYNDNYGEGDWQVVTSEMNFPVDNPIDANGDFTFTDESGQELELRFSHKNDTHFNVISTDNDSKLWMSGALGLSSVSGDYDWPDLTFPKVFCFDFDTEEFTFSDLDITGENPSDNFPMIPWDLDEDGEVDNFYSDGSVVMAKGWPCYFHEESLAQKENQFHIISDEDDNMAVVWMDGLKNRLAQEGNQAYANWMEVAEIAISLSFDSGLTWEEPFKLSSIVDDELLGMKPCYVYPQDIIEDDGGGWKKINLFFLDDYSFGSSVNGFGADDGGMLSYVSLKYNLYDDYGLLSGIVSDGEQPISGAEITISPGGAQTISDVDGSFSVFLSYGWYNIYTHVIGYENSVITGVLVQYNQQTDVDIVISALPSLFISGYVFGSDFPDIPLEGAEVNLSGYAEFSTVTDENGFYQFTEVFGNSGYTIEISASRYDDYSVLLALGEDDIVYQDIILAETIKPVTNVIATSNEDYSEVVITWDAPDIERAGENISKFNQKQDRVFETYSVYRLLMGEQSQPGNWVVLATGITELFYNDIEFGSVENGAYLFAVVAVYSNELESNPAFSDITYPYLFATVTFEISLNDGQSPGGVPLSLTSYDADPEHIYEAVTDESGIVVFEEVWFSTYTLEINLENYDNIEENIGIWQNQNIAIELIEQLASVTDFIATIEGDDILLSWTAPNSGEREIDKNVRLDSLELSRTFQHYVITRNSQLLVSGVTDNFYLDENVDDGTYQYHIAAVYTTGQSAYENVIIEKTATDNDEIEIIETELTGNYPNPFNPLAAGRCPSTTIKFCVNSKNSNQNTELEIYNLKGQKVKSFLNRKLNTGSYEVTWNGRDCNDNLVGSGVYFYRLKVGNFIQTKRMLMIK